MFGSEQLVQNPQFAQDIQAQIGHKVDTAEIDAEIKNFQDRLKKLERSKANLERDIDNITDDDRNAERKRRDMNTRLNKIYDEIYDTEDQIANCEQRRQAAEQNTLTVESIYKVLQAFDQFFDKMEREDQQKVLETLIAEIQLHPKETWKENQNPVSSIKYTFPVDVEALDGLWGKTCHASRHSARRHRRYRPSRRI